jgi:phosphatidylserine/phosphatidylglycerophosphate/cardiolipin synthase-like enzyme
MVGVRLRGTGRHRAVTTGKGARRAVALAAVLSAAGAQAVTSASSASADTPTWTEGPIFGDPNGTEAQVYAIRDRLIELTNAALPGSTIKIATYHIWDETIMDTLVAAHQRGVNVQILLDYSNKTEPSGKGLPAFNRLAAELGTGTAQASFISTCPSMRSCLGSPAGGASIMHNKYWLFSQVEGASNVVVQTTANMTPGAFTRFYNDAVLLPDNRTLYSAYSNYFRDMLGKNWAAWQYRSITSSNGLYKAYFFPRTGSSRATDTIYSILDNVQCTYKDAAGATQHTKVRVGIFKLTRYAVAEKLLSLKKAGCTVDIVYAQLDTTTSAEKGTWETLHTAGGPTLRCYDDNRNPADPAHPLSTPYLIHSKYLLVDGMYDGAPNKITFTGSHNYTGPSLRENDESLVKVDDDTVHQKYLDGFTQIKAKAWPGTADSTNLCQGKSELPQDPEKP